MLTIRMPADLRQRIDVIAESQGVPVDQLVIYILTKETGNLEAAHQMSTFGEGYIREEILSGFDLVMEKVAERPVPEWDHIHN